MLGFYWNYSTKVHQITAHLLYLLGYARIENGLLLLLLVLVLLVGDFYWDCLDLAASNCKYATVTYIFFMKFTVPASTHYYTPLPYSN